MSTTLDQKAELWALFTDAVQCVFERWTALQLALDHQMAGISTAERPQELLEHTCAFFQQYRTDVMPHEIAENLKDFFDEVFNAELDDGSPEQIGKTLVRLYRDVVVEGKTEEVLEMKAKAQSSGRAAGESVKAGDGDDSSDDEVDGSTGSDAMEVDSGPTQSETSNRRPDPVVDEDGFELVQSKKGRRRN
ncbi:uncharacterized protein SPPG_00594 [Spizellomyces punctatus DAOM BR117]|uniref:Pre-rRNA-processing protein TSR2 n=1 Tax=Spizellomyces punctatus (strain DAOM BR117) TaxID=645134 RepID=A0A0L0HVG6_SPIPD|nr:uncharacterized protein SPPG_00594 [Spizellomyces punctatus DAOM BR117]KND04900.1 hypothetical protein SPPG_00594 [Spizellomyces punctatus DAOM BR117]|eukprot:XP_016612939.1 hypothetical protein SPPG_00594 [Spizellomyces punctatus DAOM BR117]